MTEKIERMINLSSIVSLTRDHESAGPVRDDERADFWMSFPKDDLAQRVAALHRQRRDWNEAAPPKEVEIARRTIGDVFITGAGIEVGAGSRPFPLPAHAKCYYGDVRDGTALAKYFSADSVGNDGYIDAETYAGLQDKSFDFVISAHVIEHLQNPIGSIVQAMRILKPGGRHILVVPDMRFTSDSLRPPTPLAHLVADFHDNGAGTRLEAYREFLEFVAGPVFGNRVAAENLDSEAKRLSDCNMDIHFHSWTTETFKELLNFVRTLAPFQILGHTQVVNENIWILQAE